MERSERPDDEQYPHAPVPPHERPWRHPSEIGDLAWVRSEPPLSLGRGLMVATGAIGSLLAVAVLWAMLPASSDAPAAASVTVDRVATLEAPRSTRPATTLRAATSLAASTLPSLSSLVSTIASTISRATVSPQPTASAPIATVQLVRTAPEAPQSSAVAIAGSGMLLTTAKAVGDDQIVQVSIGDVLSTATVVRLDAASGVALLAPAAASPATPYAVATCAPGDHVSVLSDEPFDADVAEGEGGHLTLSVAGTAREGTPVVNRDGSLVGLYSRSDQGTELLRVDRLDIGETATTVAGSSTSAPATTSAPDGSSATTVRPADSWLGIQVDESSGAVVIKSVAVDGPAARSGLQAGDVLTALDGVAVTRRDDVVDWIEGKAPGSSVTVSYRRGGTDAQATVVLEARPSL